MKVLFPFLILLSCTCVGQAQFNKLLLRKNGKSIRTYQEGASISLETKLGMKYTGTIYLIQNDSIYFSGSGISTEDITAVLKKPVRRKSILPFDTKTFLLANAGIPLFAGGLILSGESASTALLSGVGLVYAPLALYTIQRLIAAKKRRFPIGDKYDLRILDLHPAETIH